MSGIPVWEQRLHVGSRHLSDLSAGALARPICDALAQAHLQSAAADDPLDLVLLRRAPDHAALLERIVDADEAWMALELLSQSRVEDREDHDLVLAAVQQNGTAIEWASQELLSDRGIILAAVMRNGDAVKYLQDESVRDEEIVLAAVTSNGSALVLLDDWQDNYKVVIAAVRSDGEALAFADPSLRGDREVVLAAVGQNGKALRFASASLQADKHVVATAARTSGPDVLQFAAPELRTDAEILQLSAQAPPQEEEAECEEGATG